ADLVGVLDQNWRLAGPAHIVATTPRISAIAPEAPFEFGAARFEGAFTNTGHETTLDGALDATDLNVLGRNVHMSGPARARISDASINISGDLRASADAPALFRNAALSTQFSIDRQRGRFALERARLAGDALLIDAQGWSTGGDGEFSGAWQARQLGA